MIESDCQRLKQILINLLRNSTKFTFKGFIHIVLRPKNLVLVEGNTAIGFSEAVQFEVYDTGIGISKENQECLFKLFGKVMQKNKSINKEGIGLGLFITKSLATQLGGTISVDSEEGSYTRFLLTLPVSHKFQKLRINDSPLEEGDDGIIDLESLTTYEMRVCNDKMLAKIKAGIELSDSFFAKIPPVDVKSEPSLCEVNLK